jgi:ADP-ribose pyrophosphatase YjhB (NUDIX family)
LKFCSACGGPLSVRVPKGDNRPRHVCNACERIHYQNPQVVVGCLPIWGQQILLCRRAIHPRRGFWTLPAGFMENGESTEDGAARETLEEACAEVRGLQLASVFSLPHIDQVHLFYRAELVEGRYAVGAETLEVGLFDEGEIPWSELAFATVRNALEQYFSERAEGLYATRAMTLRSDGDRV